MLPSLAGLVWTVNSVVATWVFWYFRLWPRLDSSFVPSFG